MLTRALGFVAICALTIGACADPTARPSDGANAIVEHVIDGDTIDVQIDGATERVRLLGIDAPESVDRERPVQCFGPEASEELTRLLPPQTSVLLVRDLEARDRFGRLLAYVYRADDDLFVNHQLVVSGFADVLIIDPNEAHEATLRSARRQARDAGAGLWGACDGADEPLAS
ncbi:MAG: thermonuclease family protein [Acidimicrobiia bacterium]|nr:thermonuclease family protein [Acidimicrobiia bacterium]